MIRIKGGKKEEITLEDILNKKYKKNILDLGTGDGRFVFEEAKKTPENLYIGVDPAAVQLEIYSKKANRQKIPNCYFILGSFENLPEELDDIFDEVHVNFPWGTLLKIISDPYEYYLESLGKLFKKNIPSRIISIFFGYDFLAEPKEVTRLGLPILTEDYIKKVMIPKYQKHHFKLVTFEVLKRTEIKSLPSSWSKKLAFGKSRPIYHLLLSYNHE